MTQEQHLSRATSPGLVALLGVLLAACGVNDDGAPGAGGATNTAVPRCSEQALPTPPRVDSCVISQLVPAPALPTESYTLTDAQVTRVQSGPVAGGCLDDDASPITALVLRADSIDYDVEFAVPEGAPTFAVGDIVTVNYEKNYSFFGYSESFKLTRNGTLEVYIQHGEGLSDVSSEPFTWAAGVERCSETDACGSWRKSDLTVSLDDTSVPLPYGEQVSLGDYQLHHCGYAVLGPSSGNSCADWSPGWISVAAVRRVDLP